MTQLWMEEKLGEIKTVCWWVEIEAKSKADSNRVLEK